MNRRLVAALAALLFAFTVGTATLAADPTPRPTPIVVGFPPPTASPAATLPPTDTAP